MGVGGALEEKALGTGGGQGTKQLEKRKYGGKQTDSKRQCEAERWDRSPP